MPRIEYEHPLGPARPDRIAPGDKARREQNRRRKDSDRQGPAGGKREHEDADKQDRDAHSQGPGKRVDLEV
jgi:hypothetical protein